MLHQALDERSVSSEPPFSFLAIDLSVEMEQLQGLWNPIVDDEN